MYHSGNIDRQVTYFAFQLQSWYKWRRARLESLSLLMVDLRAVLILLSPLNDLSAVQEVTGRIRRIVMRALILEEKLEV